MLGLGAETSNFLVVEKVISIFVADIFSEFIYSRKVPLIDIYGPDIELTSHIEVIK